MNARVLAPPAKKRDAYCLRLACPTCRHTFKEVFAPNSLDNSPFACELCKHEVHKVNGIWRAILPHRSAYFHDFMENYQRIRSAEGRGSATAEYYLGLPDKD